MSSGAAAHLPLAHASRGSLQRLPLAALVTAAFVALVWFVAVRQAALFVIGVGMGATLAGARFGFTTGWRTLVENRDPRGVTGQMLLLAVAAALSMPLLAAFPELNAALGPLTVSLVVGAFAFGLSMQIADGCGSGTLYKAGLGIPLNMAILPLFALGSFAGAVQLDGWLALGGFAPIGLVDRLGPWTAWGLTFGLLIAAALAVRWWVGPGVVWLDRRWLLGALALAVLATLNLVVAGQPWGVVYGFGLWVAKIAVATGLFDPAANAFWGQPGNLRILSLSLLQDITSITNIGILAGALLVAAGKPATAKPLTVPQWLVGLAAGLVMGYSSRLAFGCNVGAMVSGISTGSVHGWIWVPLAFLGTLVGIRVRRQFGF